MTSPPDDTTTDTSAIIAALRTERDAALAREAALAEALATRTAELAQRNTDYSERIEHQTATIDVLKVMAASPGDPLPVFDLIVKQAQALCNSANAALYEYDGAMVHHSSGTSNFSSRDGFEAYRRQYPMLLNRQTHAALASAILDRRIVHIRDSDIEEGVSAAARSLGVRSGIVIPLIRDDGAAGAIALINQEPGGFSDSQVALLETFAEQAVIAITSAETYRALQTRTSDLQETLEYQTATSDVLKVISRSTFDLQPVLDTLVETAARLCGADTAHIVTRDGETYRPAATFAYEPDFDSFVRGLSFSPGRDSIVGRVLLDGRVVHIEDSAADPEYGVPGAVLRGARTQLGVPLLRGGDSVGVIVLVRLRVEPFTERQIELVSTFADQAVIAIENTRLLTEQREALEQQTATAEILQVINTNPGNLTPVFDTVIAKAMRLCGATFGALYIYDGERFVNVSTRGVPSVFAEYRAQNHPTGRRPSSRGARILKTKQSLHILDVMADESYLYGDANDRAPVDLGGARTLLLVPLLKDATVLGVIVIYRQEVRAFSAKQIALLESFAAQAVIAMDNARLLTEQREALEQQTATAEVLQVINASPGDLAPVFDAILEKAHNLCGAPLGSLVLRDGEQLRAVATRGYPHEYETLARQGFSLTGSFGLLLSGEPFVHVLDGSQPPTAFEDHPMRRAAAEIAGVRTVLFVPLCKDETVLGYISAQRQEVRPFTDKQIALLQTFAAQAVIAMENARLMTEQREALEQQTATAEVLQVINASPGDLKPVFDTMLEKATRLCDARRGQLATFDGEYFRFVAVHGDAGFSEGQFTQGAVRPEIGVTWARIVAGEQVVHMVDVVDTDLYRAGHEGARRFVDVGGGRTLLTVALRNDDLLLGALTVYRQEVRAFTDKHIELLRSFAAQAVIAMENARLITEQREALEQQTATADVLQVINANPGNLTPVFHAILEKAHRLCGARVGALGTFDGTNFRALATYGYPEQAEAVIRQPYPREPHHEPLFRGETSHVRDVKTHPWTPELESMRIYLEKAGLNTMLAVPLHKDGVLLGFISAASYEVRPFSEKEIKLLENFAAQAVIAMDNARLITETREALEQQTATAEVLQVINASPGDLMPVFDAMLEKAMRLCEAAFSLLYTYVDHRWETVATRGIPAAFAESGVKYRVTGAPGGPTARLLETKRPVHLLDMMTESIYRSGQMRARALVELGGARTVLFVPLLKDEAVLGAIVIYRQEVQAFSEKQIALVENFAAQAVIAMENARLLNEIRQRQEELRVTFENMGDGVAMFDETPRLVAWNRKFQEIFDVPDALLEEHQTYAEYIRYLGERGDYGPNMDVEEQIRHFTETAGEYHAYERVRPDGRVVEIRRNPVAGGGFVLIFSDITERKRNEAEIRAARDAAEEASRAIEAAYRELKTAQANLIQAEKMASLGQLTAGIAHEIKNPLNFVNNFSALSTELIDELRDVLAPEPLGETARTEVDDLTALLKGNLEKVVQHGQRADGIVRSMLDHSRGSSGERRMVDLNALIDEALNLAYHGARAQDQSFNITLERDLGAGIAPIEVNPQDITRVFLNIFSNGFYAVTRRARDAADAGFAPTLKVTTIDAGEAVEIRVRDNGTGIPADIRDKLFQPFFTTKPTGEGTGLGLSITYDIVTQQHGGSIAVDSKVGEYSEFTIRLPRNP